MAYPAITNYSWDMGDSTTYNGAGYSTVEHEYENPGTYLVTLTLTNASAETATTTFLYVVNRVEPTITDYDWNFGDTETSTDQNPSHEYDDADTYLVTLTLTNASAETATATYLYVVNRVEPTVTNYDWNFGDTETSTDQNPSHEYDDANTYLVSLQLTDSDSDTSTTKILYNVGRGAPDYSWVFGDGNIDTGTSVSNVFASGYWDTELTASDTFGNEATDTVRVASMFYPKTCPVGLYYYFNGYTESGDYAFTDGTLTNFLHDSYGLRIRKTSGQSGTENRYASTTKSINHHSENDFWMGFTIGEFNDGSVSSTTTRHQVYFYLDDVTNSPIYDYGFCVYIEYANSRFRLKRAKDGTQGAWQNYSPNTYYDILLKKTDSILQYYVDGVEDTILSHSYEGDGNLKSEPYAVSMWVYSIAHTDDRNRTPHVYVRNLYLVATNDLGNMCVGSYSQRRLMMII